MFVHTVIMVIEPHMKQGRQHKLISTIFLATSVTKKLDHNRSALFELILIVPVTDMRVQKNSQPQEKYDCYEDPAPGEP